MRLLILAILAAPAIAAADPSVSLYHPSGMILVSLEDGAGQLAKLVGNSKQNPVRCYKESEGFVGIVGASDQAVVGCYVGVSRAGTLIPPPAGKKWSFAHIMPPLDGTLMVAPQADGALELMIMGTAGNAIGLWANCDQPATGSAMLCRQSNGMLGKFGWNIVFVVGKNGTVHPPKP